MKCFYHKSDLDGHCSGAIVKRKFPQCEMIGVDYLDKLDNFVFTAGETVYIVDFSFDIDEMMKYNRFIDIHWIDHHKSKIDEAHNLGFIAAGGQSLEIGQAGCELTWQYLYPKEPIPKAVFHLGRYDVWDHSDLDTLPFQYGMRQQDNTYPESSLWDNIFKKCQTIEGVIKVGKTIIAYEKTQNAKYAKGMSYEAEFHGLRAIIMNKAYANSLSFESVYDPEKHDIMILFGVKPGEVKYTLFCTKPDIDVSAIAKTYGGGGHKGAAGFYRSKCII